MTHVTPPLLDASPAKKKGARYPALVLTPGAASGRAGRRAEGRKVALPWPRVGQVAVLPARSARARDLGPQLRVGIALDLQLDLHCPKLPAIFPIQFPLGNAAVAHVDSPSHHSCTSLLLATRSAPANTRTRALTHTHTCTFTPTHTQTHFNHSTRFVTANNVRIEQVTRYGAKKRLNEDPSEQPKHREYNGYFHLSVGVYTSQLCG